MLIHVNLQNGHDANGYTQYLTGTIEFDDGDAATLVKHVVHALNKPSIPTGSDIADALAEYFGSGAAVSAAEWMHTLNERRAKALRQEQEERDRIEEENL